MIESRINVKKYNSHIFYGLDFFLDGVLIKRIQGITLSKEKIKDVNGIINASDVSIFHIEDIIDDILE